MKTVGVFVALSLAALAACAVDVRVDGGQGIVSGWEAYGNYVEVLDAKIGEDLGNRKEP